LPGAVRLWRKGGAVRCLHRILRTGGMVGPSHGPGLQSGKKLFEANRGNNSERNHQDQRSQATE
jgi:hypothetical protein